MNCKKNNCSRPVLHLLHPQNPTLRMIQILHLKLHVLLKPNLKLLTSINLKLLNIISQKLIKWLN